MPKLTIEFKGLLLHYERTESGTNLGKFAVVVDDSEHVPIMLIPKSAHVKDDGWVGTDGGSHFVYDLVGRSVTIENLTPGEAKASASFQKNVPSLKSMLPTSDDLHVEIPKGEPKTGVAAYVAYSGGDITVSECFEAEAVFDPAINGDPRCLAKTLKFTGSTTSGTQIKVLGGGGKNVLVEPDVVITILNSSVRGGSDHHKAFRKLLKANTEPRDLVRTVRVCENCVAKKTFFFGLNPLSTRILLSLFRPLRPLFERLGKVVGVFIVPRPFGPSVECSNSQWP